ncbi:hypothetical protein B0H17DRAFT_1192201 [Mycena rosella]|uniref:Uncharacterized protein n=1 Tax=Mycena rosella TaxID=1033263 RepID=A0AAD7MA59_MYCRO|nr:hypothetical protein B0H17DRAFT_1192201 [Mycena rosella]
MDAILLCGGSRKPSWKPSFCAVELLAEDASAVESDNQPSPLNEHESNPEIVHPRANMENPQMSSLIESGVIVDPSTLQDPDAEDGSPGPDPASEAVVAALIESGVLADSNDTILVHQDDSLVPVTAHDATVDDEETKALAVFGTEDPPSLAPAEEAAVHVGFFIETIAVLLNVFKHPGIKVLPLEIEDQVALAPETEDAPAVRAPEEHAVPEDLTAPEDFTAPEELAASEELAAPEELTFDPPTIETFLTTAQSEPERPRSPWTPSYSVVTQGWLSPEDVPAPTEQEISPEQEHFIEATDVPTLEAPLDPLRPWTPLFQPAPAVEENVTITEVTADPISHPAASEDISSAIIADSVPTFEVADADSAHVEEPSMNIHVAEEYMASNPLSQSEEISPEKIGEFVPTLEVADSTIAEQSSLDDIGIDDSAVEETPASIPKNVGTSLDDAAGVSEPTLIPEIDSAVAGDVQSLPTVEEPSPDHVLDVGAVDDSANIVVAPPTSLEFDAVEDVATGSQEEVAHLSPPEEDAVLPPVVELAPSVDEPVINDTLSVAETAVTEPQEVADLSPPKEDAATMPRPVELASIQEPVAEASSAEEVTVDVPSVPETTAEELSEPHGEVADLSPPEEETESLSRPVELTSIEEPVVEVSTAEEVTVPSVAEIAAEEEIMHSSPPVEVAVQEDPIAISEEPVVVEVPVGETPAPEELSVPHEATNLSLPIETAVENPIDNSQPLPVQVPSAEEPTNPAAEVAVDEIPSVDESIAPQELSEPSAEAAIDISESLAPEFIFSAEEEERAVEFASVGEVEVAPPVAETPAPEELSEPQELSAPAEDTESVPEATPAIEPTVDETPSVAETAPEDLSEPQEDEVRFPAEESVPEVTPAVEPTVDEPASVAEIAPDDLSEPQEDEVRFLAEESVPEVTPAVEPTVDEPASVAEIAPDDLSEPQEDEVRFLAEESVPEVTPAVEPTVDETASVAEIAPDDLSEPQEVRFPAEESVPEVTPAVELTVDETASVAEIAPDDLSEPQEDAAPPAEDATEAPIDISQSLTPLPPPGEQPVAEVTLATEPTVDESPSVAETKLFEPQEEIAQLSPPTETAVEDLVITSDSVSSAVELAPSTEEPVAEIALTAEPTEDETPLAETAPEEAEAPASLSDVKQPVAEIALAAEPTEDETPVAETAPEEAETQQEVAPESLSDVKSQVPLDSFIADEVVHAEVANAENSEEAVQVPSVDQDAPQTELQEATAAFPEEVATVHDSFDESSSAAVATELKEDLSMDAPATDEVAAASVEESADSLAVEDTVDPVVDEDLHPTATDSEAVAPAIDEIDEDKPVLEEATVVDLADPASQESPDATVIEVIDGKEPAVESESTATSISVPVAATTLEAVSEPFGDEGVVIPEPVSTISAETPTDDSQVASNESNIAPPVEEQPESVVESVDETDIVPVVNAAPDVPEPELTHPPSKISDASPSDPGSTESVAVDVVPVVDAAPDASEPKLTQPAPNSEDVEVSDVAPSASDTVIPPAVDSSNAPDASEESATEDTPLASVVPLPTELQPQAFPLSVDTSDDGNASHLDPPISPRSRLESTASSMFFPGGWFSKIPDGRASLDVAKGEFTSPKPTSPSVSSPTNETEQPDEKKGRWCVVM